mmetsp:Transcript_28718/g.52770  ORF Transcript_28718/g.52770 Transcript_28718/m.52770 type:complete len:218 (+) Transcript_28718:486-1139(+)
MINDAFESKNGFRRGLAVGHRRLEVEINNVVAIVSDIGLVTLHAELVRAASNLGEGCNTADGVLMAELNNLNGHSELGTTKAINKLGVVHNAHEEFGGFFNHFFAKKSSTTTLNNVEIRVNLVGTIDGNVDTRLFIEGGERNIHTFGMLISANRGRNTDNILQFTVLKKLTDALNSKISSGASSQADDHATLNILDSLPGSLLFQLVLTAQGSRHSG